MKTLLTQQLGELQNPKASSHQATVTIAVDGSELITIPVCDSEPMAAMVKALREGLEMLEEREQGGRRG